MTALIAFVTSSIELVLGFISLQLAPRSTKTILTFAAHKKKLGVYLTTTKFEQGTIMRAHVIVIKF